MARKALTKEEQYMVFTYYLGAGFLLSTPYLSPLPLDVRGKKDRESSFNIYESNGNLRWKDFGGTDDLNGDAVDFIIHMEIDIFNLPKHQQFSAALKLFRERIQGNRQLNQSLILKQASSSTSKHKNRNPIVDYDTEFYDFESKYWLDRYTMNVEFLLTNRCYAFRGIDWGDGFKNTSTPSDPAFIFDLSEKGDMSSWKIYRPLTKNKRYKWKSWNLSAIPFEGYYLLPDYGERLLFTSGRKDGYTSLMLDKIFDYYFNWSVGNPTGENAYKSILPYVPELKERFDWIGIIFDGDKTGMESAKHFHELTGFAVWHLPYPNRTKDISEVVEDYNYSTLFDCIVKCTISTPYIK